MGVLFSSVKDSSRPSQKRKYSSFFNNNDSSPIKKRIHSTYEYVYRELFCKGEGSDIIVSALGYEWLLHRIYIKQSPFFSAMLDGGWKESDCNKIELELSDKNITKHSLDVVFGSFYCDCVTLSDQTVLSILAGATWFHLEDIRQSCSGFLERNIRLDTVIEMHATAVKYSLPELNKACIDWLSRKLLVLSDSFAYFSLLQNIPISLMQSVVNHPQLVVVQLEQDVFICLLKWMYLRHHPDQEYCSASQLLKEAYEYFTFTKPNFLASPEGIPYAAAFGGVRWAHVVTIYKATHRMIQDRIVPESWLAKAFQRQWLQLLSTHESQCSSPCIPSTDLFSRSSAESEQEIGGLVTNFAVRRIGINSRTSQSIPGPREDLPEDLFWQFSERYGRRMCNGETTCSWRWTGFHFGLDVLIKYRRRVFHVIRLTDVSSSEGSVCRSREHRLMISMTILSASSDSYTPEVVDSGNDDSGAETRKKSNDTETITSGIKHFNLTENGVYEILRLPETLAFPVIVSANILRYDPILPSFPSSCQTSPFPVCDSAHSISLDVSDSTVF